jgi:SDR family mycofactocin-dependent oxidoreductase
MPGALKDKVALVTGAARGQGRSHAVCMAEEGADVIAIDLCGPVRSVQYPAPTRADLAETASAVEGFGRRAFVAEADVRDIEALTDAVDAAAGELGRLDVVVANAGIVTFGAETHEVGEDAWQDLMDVNVTGVWHTYKASARHLIKTGPGGSVIIVSSLAGLRGLGNSAGYTTTKHAIVGLMKVLANELGPRGIRVNTIHPNTVDTPMIQNEALYRLVCPDLEHPTAQDVALRFALTNPMGVPWLTPRDVSNAVVWLASDKARYVTGAQIPVDCGAAIH